MSQNKAYHIPYGKQHITEEDIAAVVATLRSDFLTQGPAIAHFEEAFASYIGAKYAVAVANGTAALHLCALALEVNEKSKVITSPITFAASANCIRYCNGEVAFCDINPDTLLIDLAKLEAMLQQAPEGEYQGIIPVDFAGYPVHMEALAALAQRHGLWIIEDSCHAPGASFQDSKGNWQQSGNGIFADLAIFSFHPVKHIASGEGGMITTNNPELYEKLLLLRTHGITKRPDLLTETQPGGWYYEMQTLGYNYRLTDIQAALGLSQLQRADVGLARRREIAARYEAAFAETAIAFTTVAADSRHAYHLFVVQVPERRKVYDELRKQGIFTQVHYIPVHLLPYYQALGWKHGDFPHAEAYYEKCLSLPMFPSLTDEEQDYVIEQVKAAVAQA